MEIRKLTEENKDVQALLTRTLKIAAAQYYNTGSSAMTDFEFDRQLNRLKNLEELNGFAYEGSPTIAVGAPTAVSALKTVRHEQEALSLDKVKYAERETLIDWLNNQTGILSWKMDGLTVVATYDNGKLTSAVTRGNGIEGDDVTHNARFFKGLPETIKDARHIVIRGEAVMTYEEFERVNAENDGIYENARNLASATIRMLDSNESRKREIRFYAFQLVEPAPRTDALQYEDERFAFLQGLGIQTVTHCLTACDHILADIDAWQGRLKENEYPTDGLVLSYNDQVYAESLGSTLHHPRGSVAMKWTDETKETILRDVEWSVGKTGIITPVAIFDPVRLGVGSTVTRASMHNLSIMENIPHEETEAPSVLQIGSKIQVGLANMIIPQVYLQKPGEPGTMRPIKVPEVCPVCGEKTWQETRESVKVLHCQNAGCPARTRGMLVNAFGRSGLNVKGLGPSQIEDLQQAKLMDVYPAEAYTLRKRTDGKMPAELASKDGWGEKSWQNLLNAIDKSRKTTLQRFLYSLGIPLLGNDLSKKLSSHWNGDIEEFKRYYENPTYEELVDLEGVGPMKAGNVYDWCRFTKSDATKNLMVKILMDELEFDAPVAKTDATLTGLTFVITGAVHIYKNRDEFKASVEARGGKVSGSVSKRSSYLVCNSEDSTSTKALKAAECGVPVLSEEMFIEKFGK